MAEIGSGVLFPDEPVSPRFASRAFEQLVGQIILDPSIAVSELVSNAHDAGATRVDIEWEGLVDQWFSIRDNGVGLTREEFAKRWVEVAYNRRQQQTDLADVVEGSGVTGRIAFGQNGVGRFAPFCFGDVYFVDSSKLGRRIRAQIRRLEGKDAPFVVEALTEEAADRGPSGVLIRFHVNQARGMTVAGLRRRLAERFLSRTGFLIRVNGEPVALGDVPEEHKESFSIPVPGGQSLQVVRIETDIWSKDTEFQGVAWHVNGKLVGPVSWDLPRHVPDEQKIDGRTKSGRRLVFIVKADHLRDSVRSDWSGFRETDDWKSASSAFFRSVYEATHEERMQARADARERSRAAAADASGLDEDSVYWTRWESTVRQIQEDCPSLKPEAVEKIGVILSKMERASTKYAFLDILAAMESGQMDRMVQLLQSYGSESVLAALEEVERRLAVIRSLEERIRDPKTLELQGVHPVMEDLLWAFGPEFEGFHYSSNESLNQIVKKQFGGEEMIKGGRNRPDILLAGRGEDQASLTVKHCEGPGADSRGAPAVRWVTILELKRPSKSISWKDMGQGKQYAVDLFMSKVCDFSATHFAVFVIGGSVDPGQEVSDQKANPIVTTYPMSYDDVLRMARSRMLKLHEVLRPLVG
ncbi:MAG: ATP-binding protein [Fimbriimonadaceae bacterium]|nr:ATP-binding protein [Fimbriimonadaceae bacterium]